MSEKFEKYWSCSSTSLAIACFLDPRYKKKIVEYYMRRFYGDSYQVWLDEFVLVVKKLYQFYASSKPTSSKSPSHVNANVHVGPMDPLFETDNSDLDKFLYDDPETGELGELDKYMKESLIKETKFDILAYWKNNKTRYHVLSQIGCDMMAIQVSTVASESAFSGAGRVIDPYRNRLDPEMVQALICTKDWIRGARKGTVFLFIV
jgi:hypothetical protein